MIVEFCDALGQSYIEAISYDCANALFLATEPSWTELVIWASIYCWVPTCSSLCFSHDTIECGSVAWVTRKSTDSVNSDVLLMRIQLDASISLQSVHYNSFFCFIDLRHSFVRLRFHIGPLERHIVPPSNACHWTIQPPGSTAHEAQPGFPTEFQIW